MLNCVLFHVTPASYFNFQFQKLILECSLGQLHKDTGNIEIADRANVHKISMPSYYM